MQVTKVAERFLVALAASTTLLLALTEVTVMAVIPRVVSGVNGPSGGPMDASGNSSISGSVGIQHRLYLNRYGKQPEDNGEDELFRSSRRSDREPRFISFQTKDDNIEGVPMLNINVGAVILAGFLAIAGALLGSAIRLFRGQNVAVPFSFPQQVSTTDQLKNLNLERGNDYHSWNPLWSLMETVDKSLQKFDIDSTACTQRMVCWYVKEAMNNVSEQRAGKLDVVINGLSSADWAMKFTTGTAIEDAIRVGRRNVNCEQAFPSCRIAPEAVQRMIKNSSKGRSKK